MVTRVVVGVFTLRAAGSRILTPAASQPRILDFVSLLSAARPPFSFACFLPINHACTLQVNAGQRGFFKVNYTDKGWANLSR